MFDTSRRVRRASTLLGLTALVLAPAAAQAQGSALPDARTLIAKYAQAVGGDAWKKHKSARMKATMDMGANGMTGTMEVVQLFPNSFSSTLTLPGMGELRSGYDGTTAWSMNPMMGPQVLSGAQADAIREQADPESALRTSPNIVSTETVEKATMNGQECYKVKITFKTGNVTTDCYSVSDGLLVATMAKTATPMGDVESTTYSSNYKDFGGMKRATNLVSEAMGQRSTITITSWEWDNVEARELELPAEIKALVKKP
jgi:hypothetical protein